MLEDADGNFFEDNDERSLFFVRGVLETVRKLGWAPDIIHCSGWMTSLVPLYLKHVFADEPYFENAKVIYHAYDEGFEGSLDAGMAAKAEAHGIPADALASIGEPTFENLNALGMQGADAIIVGSEELSTESQAVLAAWTSPSCLTAEVKGSFLKSTPSTTPCWRERLRLSRSKGSSC